MITGPVAAYTLAVTLAMNDPLVKPIGQYFCMSEAIHMEAQGESYEGKKAVANVILNRVRSDRYPNTICKVVNQRYQFSYRNSKVPMIVISDRITRKSFTETSKIAYDAVQGRIRDNTNGATHYLNPSKIKRFPKWFKIAKMKLKIDNHIFVKL